MAYIGVSPSNGVRRVYTYTATANQTSFSGVGAENITLSYKDANYVDVYQNGVKLASADYTATSGTAIVLGTGATVNDMVVIVVFDVFSAADTVSKADGGQFDGNVTMAGTLGVTGVLTGTSLDISGDIDVNGVTNLDNTDIDGTLNVQGETTLQTHLNLGDNDKIKLGDNSDLEIYHNGANSFIEDVGTGALVIRGANQLYLQSTASNNYFVGESGGAVTLYHNNNAKLATTSSGVTVTGNIANASGDMTIDVAGDIILDADGGDIQFNDGGTHVATIKNTGSAIQIRSEVSDADLVFVGNDGGAATTMLTLDTSLGGVAKFNAAVQIPQYLTHLDDTDTFLEFGTDQIDLYAGNAKAITIGSSQVIINQDSADVDFRVESNNDANAFFVEGSTGNIGIGTNSPAGDFHLTDASDIRILFTSDQTGNTASDGTFIGVTDGGNFQIFNRENAGIIFTTNGTTAQTIRHDGAITKPLQPAFLVTMSSNSAQFGNGQFTPTLDTEIFDQGGDFSSNTFTAPVTGRYQLSWMVYAANLDTSASYYYLRLTTSNREYNKYLYTSSFDSDVLYYGWGTSILADMDVNDTATFHIGQVNGHSTTQVYASNTYASGALIC